MEDFYAAQPLGKGVLYAAHPMAWGTYMLRKPIIVVFFRFRVKAPNIVTDCCENKPRRDAKKRTKTTDVIIFFVKIYRVQKLRPPTDPGFQVLTDHIVL